MSEKLPKVQQTNNKQDIFSAYKEVYKLAENLLKESKAVNPIEIKEAEAKTARVETAVKTANLSNIFSQTKELKLGLNGLIDELNAKIEASSNKLAEINEAVEEKKKELKETFEIEKNLLTLQALIVAQDNEKQIFEQIMKDKKLEWEKEKTEWFANFNEQKNNELKERKIEQEQFDYNKKLERRNADQAFNEEKAKRMKELQTYIDEQKEEMEVQRQLVDKREQHMNELEAQVAGFPEELKKAVAKNEAIISNAIKKDYEIKATLEAKDKESRERELMSEIKALTEKNVRLDSDNIKLTSQLQTALLDMKEIANSAVNSSKSNIYVTSDDKKKA